jgi:formylglycine-generating enzyme required for sulfatase activity
MKKSLILLFIFSSLSNFCFLAAYANKCEQVYSEINNLNDNSQTNSVKHKSDALLQLLSPELQTGLRSLAELHLHIALTKQKNPDSIVAVSLNDAYQKKYQEYLDYFLNNKIINENEMISIMKGYVLEKQGRIKQDKELKNERAKIEREQIIKNPIIDGTRAVMHRIEPGSFKMGEITVDHKGVLDRSKQVDKTITEPFDMMATPTTNIIWKKIADLAAQKLPGKYKIIADGTNFKDDTSPVENVSYDDIQTWLMALNELSTFGDPALDYLIPNHKIGDIYRLPTEAEWEFVIRGRGQYNDLYHFGNNEEQLGEYAWYFKNSGGKSHPVAEKKPLVIDGKEFYDMIGNVMEWVNDQYLDRKNLPIGQSGRVAVGGSWNSIDFKSLRSGYRYGFVESHRSFAKGFRFVRTSP